MNKFLHLTAGQLFMLFIGLPLILNILDILISPSASFSFYYVAPLITLLGLSVLYIWYWTVGVNIFMKLPQGLNMQLTMFKTLLVVSYCLISLAVCLQLLFLKELTNEQFSNWSFLMFIPQLLAMPCLLYCFYFIAKALKTSETKRSVIFSDYSTEFWMLLFFPIGVWFIQPRINKIFEA